MNRRDFINLGGAAAAAGGLISPTLGAAAVPAETKPGIARTINFQADGLGLTPADYAALLSAAAAASPPAADNYSIGGLIEALEKKFALMLGKEAAVFLPTGTLANHLAIRKLAGEDRRVLVQAESHFYNDSGDGAATLSGLTLIPLAPGEATFPLAEVEAWVTRSAGGRVPEKIGVIAIESPVRRKDHAMFRYDEMARISAYAHERGIRLHLDGARLFNQPQHSGKSLADYGALFDTVYVSLWKHFNGTAGAIIAGDRKVIDGLFHTRRMFGGSLPQAWPAVGLVGPFADTYLDDYARAWRVADAFLALLEKSGRFEVKKIPEGTSRFFLSVPGVDADKFSERLRASDVAFPTHPLPGTTTFGVQVNPSFNRITPEKLAERFLAALAG